MSFLTRVWRRLFGASVHGIAILVGEVTLGSDGAIASQLCHGFSVAETDAETGRYTITIDGTVTKLFAVIPTLVGADDTAYTSDKGVPLLVRDDDVATDGTIELQCVKQLTVTGAQTYVDAVPADSAKLKLVIIVQLSSVN